MQKVLKGRATVHEWWYDLKKPTLNQYLTWIYLIMGRPTWWTLPVRKMPFQPICWPSLDRNFRSAINNRLDRGRIFLPKVQKKQAQPENYTWKLGLTQAWSHIGLGLDKKNLAWWSSRVEFGLERMPSFFRPDPWLDMYDPWSGMYIKLRTIWDASSLTTVCSGQNLFGSKCSKWNEHKGLYLACITTNLLMQPPQNKVSMFRSVVAIGEIGYEKQWRQCIHHSLSFWLIFKN